jgi:acetyltransferase
VITDLYSKESLISAYAHLLSILKKHKLEGKIILQKQVKGLELIVGINKDEQFGKIILFGQGGIYTEVLDDTAIRILPIGKKEIEEMIFSTRISKLFFARGVIYDTKKIIDLIENISRISSKVQELDLNPVIFTKEGVYIVDARVKLED